LLSFGGGARIEAMSTTKLQPLVVEPGAERMGVTHIAISVGSDEKVDRLTIKLPNAGIVVESGPRGRGTDITKA